MASILYGVWTVADPTATRVTHVCHLAATSGPPPPAAPLNRLPRRRAVHLRPTLSANLLNAPRSRSIINRALDIRCGDPARAVRSGRQSAAPSAARWTFWSGTVRFGFGYCLVPSDMLLTLQSGPVRSCSSCLFCLVPSGPVPSVRSCLTLSCPSTSVRL